MDKPILIVSALKIEVSIFISSLTSGKDLSFSSVELMGGYYKDSPILILISGIGKENVEGGLQKVLNKYRVSSIISIGISGGVSNKLKFNDIVIQKAIYHINDSDRLMAIPLNSFIIKKISSAFDICNISYKVKNGLTVKKPLLKSSEKAQISYYPVSLVDMESYIIAEIAKRNKILFTSIRIIFDTVTEDLIKFSSFIDAKSKVMLTRLIVEIVKNPLLIKELIGLNKKINIVGDRVSFIIKTVILFLGLR